MSRWLWPWSNCVKERVCRYLLHHYLGHFFQEHLSLDQLSLDLYKGSVVLRDIHLEIWSVNEVLESTESPLELVEGFVGSIEVAVPWAALLTDHCTVHVLEYCDEAVRDPSQAPPVDVHQPPAFLHKLLQLAGVRLHFEELRPQVGRLWSSQSLSPPNPCPLWPICPSPSLLTIFGCIFSPPPLPCLLVSQEGPPEPPLQIGSCSGCLELTVKLKQNEAFPGPKLEVCGQLGSLHLLLTPRQLQQLQELLGALSLADPEGLVDKLNKSRPLGAEDLWLIEQDLNQQLQAGTVAEPLSSDPLSNPLVNLESTDLFFSMAGLTSSVASALSELSLSDVDLGTSVHSNVASRRLSAQGPPTGKTAPAPPLNTLRPDSLLKMTLGGVTLTLLQTSAPSSGPPDLTTHFFAEFDATKDGSFGSHDFYHLRPRFQRACPCSHVRLTGAAVQLSWELRTSRGRRITSTEVHFGQLEVLECLWPRGTSEPEYTEVLSFPGSLRPQASAQPCAHLRHTQTLRRLPKLSAQWEVIPEKGEELELSAENLCELREPEPSPFSSKRTMYETEEMVIPGDPEEMRTFQSRALALSRCSLEVVLPGAHVFLPSKEVYESLYNRINNDLLMWEPADLLPTPTPATRPTGFPDASGFWHDSFKMCKSAFKLDSDSDDEDTHFSVGASGTPQRLAPEPQSPHSQSTFSTLVTVLKGRITAHCETKYRGQPGLGYFCLEAEKATLYHRAAVDDYLLPSRLEVPTFAPPAQLARTIYPSEEGMTEQGGLGRKGQGRGPHMLSTAVRIQLDPHRNVKEFLVTLRLHRATLRHYMALPEQSWHSQLLEFLDVLDDPVLGYLPPTVITILHVHLFSCAVDYRPLYLPVRVLVTAETFTLSSNIVMDTSTFLLRFILDDSALYLSDKCEMETLDLRRDYVCVLDVDLLELVIKTWKGSTEDKLSQPLFELRCSNNVMHVHSCADSCALLVNLLQYVMRSPFFQASPVSVYLFPGERSGAQPPSPLVGAPTGSLGSHSEAKEEEKEEEGDGDTLDSDEFCILDAPGLGILPQDGEPVVTQLHPDPIIVQDGHFSQPLGSTDLLRAPAHFPVPSSRVVLREVSLVWHLYGGRDFGPHPGHRARAGLTGPRSSPSRCSGPNRPQNSWRAQGGSGRQHHVLMEIQLSKINKFLYLHTSERMPRRTHSNMVQAARTDALLFLRDFFTSLAASINPVVPAETSTEGQPEGVETTSSQEAAGGRHGASPAEQQPIYFREFRFTSEVPIWLDYHGKHVTMDQVLNCSELKLKRLCCRHGLLGVDKVLGYALNEWLQDIRKNQLPGLLGGVGPMHSVVQLCEYLTLGALENAILLGSLEAAIGNRWKSSHSRVVQGFRDLLWLPIEQYRKDGRLMRGLQRGAASFGSSTASAALELSNRLVQAIQGLTGAVGGVIRQLPPTVVKPLILATEATSNLLGGMRNQILPDAHKDHALKWRLDEARD
ncbi:hypothetical protein E2I00_008860 [Balaenoptera physalus]|uniref:Autophagy related 2A n=1 Tax=Balaenoptera physalus TaxID=9770 RepID=A0A6A1Q915_BALPH|nr:hypothetical protein E2I00_008860 [Balaenoptera physalus]